MLFFIYLDMVCCYTVCPYSKRVHIIDKDYIPGRTFRGPLFLSGNGLWVSREENPALYKNIDRIMHNLEGDKSIFDLAQEFDMDFYDVLGFVDKMLGKGLVTKVPFNS